MKQQDFQTIIPPNYFAHIGMALTNYVESIEWYTYMLNANYTYRGVVASMMTYDDEHHRASFFNFPFYGNRIANKVGVSHVSFSFSRVNDLMQTYTNLYKRRFIPYQTVRCGDSLGLHYKDPDGNDVNLVYDAMKTVADLKSGFSLGPGATNIGETFDPDKYVQEYKISESSPLIPPAALDHVVIRTKILEQQVKFYQKMLGCKVVYKDENICYLSFGKKLHDITMINDPNAPDNQREVAGFDHLAFSWGSMADLIFNVYERLKQEGIHPEWSVNHGVTTSLYYRDLENNLLELQTDNLRSNAAYDSYFKSGNFQIDPVGKDFDPDRMIELVKEGVPLEVLAKKGAASNKHFKNFY